MTTANLTDIVKAVQEDPQPFTEAIARRVAKSKEADSVCMMGGWTHP
jgi:hypothetical protein